MKKEVTEVTEVTLRNNDANNFMAVETIKLFGLEEALERTSGKMRESILKLGKEKYLRNDLK